MALSILEEIGNLARSHQLPYHVLLELTYGCNLRCVMCYNPTHTASNELSLDEYVQLFDELMALGTVQLTFTGGEVLARPDFWDIARAARDRHFALRIFTNGTRVDAETARRFAALAPLSVEVSLYGGTAATHDAVTARPGSFERTLDGIRHLKAAGVRVVAKALLTQLNKHEVTETCALIDELDVHFKGFDPVVFATHAGDEGPIDLRVPGDEVARLLPWDLIDSEDLMTGDEYAMCSAGHDFASITPHGLVYPCLSMRLPMGNIRERSFKDIWTAPEDALLSTVRDATWGDLPTCSGCDARAGCDRCPGLAYHEAGDVLGPSAVHCEHAFARLESPKVSTTS
jgi:radical SAM protein with 4Fe4S-binding SPASM domain